MDQKTLERHMDILGVKTGDSAEIVRAAWKKQVKLTHPDRNPGVSRFAFLAVSDAYEALKDGVPSPKPPQAAEAPQTAPRQPAPARPAAPPRAREPYEDKPLHEDEYLFDKAAQARLEVLTAQKLEREGYPLPKQTWAQKLTGKPARYPIITPRAYIFSWRMVIIELDCKTVPVGENYIALPLIAADGDRLKRTNVIGLYIFTQHENKGLRLRAHEPLSKLLMPQDLSHFKVYMMTPMNPKRQ